MATSIKKIMGIERNSIRKLNKLQLYEELFCNSLFSDANLIAYYRFEGNSNDNKGSNNGTDTNITYSTSNGKFNQGAGFNGSSSKIALSKIEPSALTISAWVNAANIGGTDDSDGNRRTIVNNFYFSGGVYGYAFDIAKQKFRLNISDNSGTSRIAYSSTTPSTNTWYFVVGTYDGTSKLYLNGSLEGSSGSGSGIRYHSSSLQRIGINDQPSNDKWNGYIDDIAIFNRALSSTEITSLYNSQIKKFIGVSNI